MKVCRALSFVCLALALALAPTTLPSAVRADDPEPEVSTEPAHATATTRDRWDRLLAVEMIGGIDTPYGVFGGAVVVSPIRYLALDLGGGVSRDGGRVAGGARLVLPHENGALGLRLGFAGGPLTWDTQTVAQPSMVADPSEVTFVHQRRTWEFVGFVDLSLSLEIRFDMGIYARLLFGVEHALANADRCEITDAGGGTCGVTDFTPTRSYLGLALGYAFDL